MVRILVVGPLPNIESVVPKITKVNAKSGPFEFCILLRPPSTLPGTHCPIPTYFIADSFDSDSTPRLVARNMHYMGDRCNKLIHGLQLIMCANDEGATALYDDFEKSQGTNSEVDVMVSHSNPRDIPGEGNDPVSRLGRTARPRYCFYGADLFHASDPLRLEGCNYATRMVGVGRSGRWVYAADVTPLRDMSVGDRRDTLGSKLLAEVPARRERKRLRDVNDKRKGGTKRVRKDCWFCLSNEVEKHLVVAVGEHTYVALAKGGINDSHMVIVPVAHITGGTSKLASEEMMTEVNKQVKVIKRYYAEKKGSEAMVFEWCGEAEMMHMCVQSVALRKEVCGRVADVCRETAKRFGMEAKIEEGTGGLSRARGSGARECFWAELPGGKHVVAKFEEKKKLPANFGRIVVAQALGLVERIEWRKCVSSRQAEEELAEKVASELEHVGASSDA